MTTPRGRKRETFSCVPGQKAEGTRTKRGSKRGLLASRFRAHQPRRRSSSRNAPGGERGGKGGCFPPPFSPSRALPSPPFPSRTLPSLAWSIRLAHLPPPSFHPCLPVHPRIFLIFSRTSPLTRSHLPPFRSSSPLGLLYTQSPNLAFAHARLNSRPLFRSLRLSLILGYSEECL